MKAKKICAVTRAIPQNFASATVRSHKGAIRVDLARRQHEDYVDALRALNVNVTVLSPCDSLPDSCFVEDTVVSYRGVAALTYSANVARRAESALNAPFFEKCFSELYEMAPPATADGGDCLFIGDTLYVGLSDRTNRDGAQFLRSVFSKLGVSVVEIEVRDELHLKCTCSYLGNNRLLLAEGSVDESRFKGVDVVKIPREESYAGNVIAIQGKVLMPRGFAHTRRRLLDAGFEVIELDTSEIAKADGSLTCLSVLFEDNGNSPLR